MSGVPVTTTTILRLSRTAPAITAKAVADERKSRLARSPRGFHKRSEERVHPGGSTVDGCFGQGCTKAGTSRGLVTNTTLAPHRHVYEGARGQCGVIQRQRPRWSAFGSLILLEPKQPRAGLQHVAQCCGA